MKVLLIGGTGPIGTALIQSNKNHDFYVTSRQNLFSNHSNIRFIKANGMDDNDLEKILKFRYDVIIDFMNYKTTKFINRYLKLLSSTDHYIFISSARVYSNQDYLINSKTNRLLDANIDNVYSSSDEYALAKARQENLLIESGFENFTILRPYITYHHNRLQFGPFEKEEWLKGIIKHKLLVVYDGMLEKITTMTSALDVASYIGLVIDRVIQDKIINVASTESLSWAEILSIYKDVLKGELELEFDIVSISKDAFISKFGKKDQINYDRDYDRRFAKESYHLIPFNKSHMSLAHSTINLIRKGTKNIRMNCHYEYQLSSIRGRRNILRYYWCRMINKLKSISKV